MNALRTLPPAVLGSLLIVMGGTFAGILGPLARLLYDEGMTPLAFIVWRGGIAGVALWLLVLVRRRRDRARNGFAFGRLPRHERLALLGFITSNLVLSTSLFEAFDRIPIAVALLTFYTYPVLLALYGRVSRTESLGPIKVASLVLSLFGLALVVTANMDATSGPGLDPLGLALGCVSAVSAAAWVGFGRACPSVPTEQAMGLALTVTVVAVGALAVLSGPADAIRFPLDHTDLWPTILVSGLLSGAGAAWLFATGMRLLSRVRAGILGLVEPIVGTLAATVLLAQVLAPAQVLGGALVLGAAVLIQRDGDDAGAATRAGPIADQALPPPEAVV